MCSPRTGSAHSTTCCARRLRSCSRPHSPSRRFVACWWETTPPRTCTARSTSCTAPMSPSRDSWRSDARKHRFRFSPPRKRSRTWNQKTKRSGRRGSSPPLVRARRKSSSARKRKQELWPATCTRGHRANLNRNALPGPKRCITSHPGATAKAG